ncbi:endoplasmic reticulum metallopeptidase 1-like isoform X1 [Bradysia coprophila]|uniref:endoplasmic reticulum metallopeptidase 1-like isoform X1 n=1 Tax=Bradysia coprophila TaxID=38358 RepID=UPI00187DC195|nr:endoplasmic reticulum metallopeptidase 1-like isoform X1 [Bradysia coprophila]
MDKQDDNSVDSGKTHKAPVESETISIYWLPVFILPWIVLYIGTLLSYQTLPTPILLENEAQYPHRFVAERAKRLNDELTGIGPRVVGSIENEVLAIQFLEREVQKIIESRNVIHNIEYEVQNSSGSFELDLMTSVYNDIQNFVVRFTPADRIPSHFLLINSHFDTVPISPGAGDSATMVVVMMEILRVLSISPDAFEHGIVFLFNGAEEVGLQGSHMFITKHRWAADVRAVLNMDSAGIGGRELMFQTTPNNFWMLKYYKENAFHPTATVLFNELFDMKIIPSDTDFRIFRDYGKIPGLDFAIYRNGYVYHTQSDRSENVPLGTYQNVGDNILSLTKAILNAEELRDPKAYDQPNPIYFDYLGWFMITYPVTVAIIINVFVSIICLVGIVLSIWSHIKNFDLSASMVSIQFGLAIIIQCVSIVLGAGLVIILSIVYDACNRSLSYFSNHWILFGIFYCPLLFCLGLGCALHITFLKKKEIHTHLYVQLYLHAQSVFFIILILAMTAVGIKTTFTVTFTLAFYTLTMFISFFSKLQLKANVYWTLLQFVGQVFPYMFLAYYTILTLEVFVPVQGRSGPTTNPDSMIAVTSILLGLLIGYLMPTFSLFKRPLLVVSGFLVLFVVAIIVIATPAGFPFSTTSPQRFWIFDTQRTFHNLDGSVRKSDDGYFMLIMDRHTTDYIKDTVPEMSLAIPTQEQCETELFCGVPLYTTRMLAQSKYSFWIPHASTSRPLPVPTRMELVSRATMADNVQRLTFEISGPDHMGLFISPKLGNKVIDWTPLDIVQKNVPKWGERTSYFVFLGHGGTNTPIEFFIDVQGNNTTDGIVDMAIVGHYTHYDELESAELQTFIKSFPEWTQMTHWMSTYEGWVF